MAILNKSMRNRLRIITFYCKGALRMEAKETRGKSGI